MSVGMSKSIVHLICKITSHNDTNVLFVMKKFLEDLNIIPPQMFLKNSVQEEFPLTLQTEIVRRLKEHKCMFISDAFVDGTVTVRLAITTRLFYVPSRKLCGLWQWGSEKKKHPSH